MDSIFLKIYHTFDPIEANRHLKIFLTKVIENFFIFPKKTKKLKGQDRSKNLPEIWNLDFSSSFCV